MYAGLLFTHTRAAFAALALGLLVLAVAQRRWTPAVLAAASVAVSGLFLVAYPTIGPSTSYTPARARLPAGERRRRRRHRWRALGRRGIHARATCATCATGSRSCCATPGGTGSATPACRRSARASRPLAGESTYTELGVDAGLAGALLFIGWLAALVAGLWRRSAWLAAAVVAMAAVGVQTDVIGVHWLAVVLFALAGAALTRQPADTLDE